MKALVTGGAGFIGSHIVDLLIEQGHEAIAVDNLVTGRLSNLHSQARFFDLDVCSEDMKWLMESEQPDIVFHEAAQMSVKVSTDNPAYDARVNVLGFINTLQACVVGRVKKFVFASSGATYGNPKSLPFNEDSPQRPESPYGITKMTAEHYLRYFSLDFDLRFSVLRYGNVYGPRQDSLGEAGVIAMFARQLLDGETPVIHWDGEQVRDYVYVADVARANLLAASVPGDSCYCIGTGKGTSVNSLYLTMCRMLDIERPAKHGPRRAGDLRAAYFDISRASRDLRWMPEVTLESGIRSTLESCREAVAVAGTDDDF